MSTYKKLRKLIRTPGKFFSDSKSPFLRGFAPVDKDLDVKSNTRLNNTKKNESSKPVSRIDSTKTVKADPLKTELERKKAELERKKAELERKKAELERKKANALLRRRIYTWNPNNPGENPYTSHFFASHKSKIEKVYGTASLPWKINSERAFVPALIRNKKIVAPFLNPLDAPEIDVFISWGVTDSVTHNLARATAQLYERPLILLEYGFVSSFGLAVNGSPQHSIIANIGGMYYDATCVSHIERRLNSEDFLLDIHQIERSQKFIAKILEKKITKYNHAPEMCLDSRIPRDGKYNILLVDQRFGDKSITSGLSGDEQFAAMAKRATQHPNARVIVKIHPDAISGGKESYLARQRELFDNSPNPVVYFADDANPFDLLKNIDEVFVATSQLGFEALMAEKKVTCFGMPWYAGWGLTNDTVAPLRARRSRSLLDLFFLGYIESSTYYVPGFGISELDVLIEYLANMRQFANRGYSGIAALPSVEGSSKPGISDSLAKLQSESPRCKVLFVLASNKASATGRYIQDLAASLMRFDYEVVILADGEPDGIHAGIKWLKLEFEGARLSRKVRGEILRLNPDIVYENGVRSRPQRAALEALFMSDARLAMQSEDDDVQIYETRTPDADSAHLVSLDRPRITNEQITAFLTGNNWGRTLGILFDPNFDRWIEPITRILCCQIAQLHTAIWYPYESRLKKEYGKPTLVVPPGIAMKSFSTEPSSAEDRLSFCAEFNLSPDTLTLFVAGTVYDYSDEYVLFLKSLKSLHEKSPRKMVLFVIDGRTRLEVKSLAESILPSEIGYVNLTKPTDEVYLRVLRMCHIVCSPGIEDRFTKYRLPSRLVKAMAMGKVVLTSSHGFGESLIHGYNAILTTGNDPAIWSREIGEHLSDSSLEFMGKNAREFAEQNFDIDKIAERLHESFVELLKLPPSLSSVK